MARYGRYKVPFRRRREGLTNYYKRRKMILSGKPRLVVRVSNRHVIVQVIKAEPQGDVTLASAHSKELESLFGWKAGTKSTPAAYLVGMLAAYRALERGVREAILDIGLRTAVKGARVFAAAKGAVDAGLKLPLGSDIVPSDDRIRGLHIANYAKLLREEGGEGAVKERFSNYLKRGLNPEELPEHFEEVKQKIIEHFS